MGELWACLSVWYKTKFGSQNLATKLGVFLVIYVMFKKYVQCGSNNDVIKYCVWGIPHNWDMIFEKFGGLPTLVAFQENKLARQEQINYFKYERQQVHWSAPHH